jgi:hypothetical protein
VSIRNELCYIMFTSPRGSLYNYDPGTRDVMSSDPLLPDPYETQYCYVRTSKIKGAKEGIFAKRDLLDGTIVAFYNGVRMRSNELDADKADWEANAYKIMDLLGADEDGVEGVLDIPTEYVSLKKYKASLAHKANHSFQPNARDRSHQIKTRISNRRIRRSSRKSTRLRALSFFFSPSFAFLHSALALLLSDSLNTLKCARAQVCAASASQPKSINS